ncbi:MAG: hypothetical protein FD149_2122 [Rhodospirillaceae bacterium]|nr:MAG: hypothetical protein FD149_2122 [Rhodospirillaceae bacterium]
MPGNGPRFMPLPARTMSDHTTPPHPLLTAQETRDVVPAAVSPGAEDVTNDGTWFAQAMRNALNKYEQSRKLNPEEATAP